MLVASLRDGNAFVPANNKTIEHLIPMGERAFPAILAAMQDEHFPGRGYAGWALAKVLEPMDRGATATPAVKSALQALEDALSVDVTYVKVLARSGLDSLKE